MDRVAPSSDQRTARAVRDAVWLLGLGAIVGASLGMLACGMLSGGRAALGFYVIYFFSGAVIGIIGSVFGGVLIGIMRLVTRITSRCPTTTAHNVAIDDRPKPDE
jgi:hypothetical protein